ncbi:hypothetical protein M569_06489, partial [Genlisea aurea]
DDIRREAQTMSLIEHPNVIRAFCSFVVDRNLWVVMPFMAEGSCLHLMKTAYPEGFEESAIGSILRETLKALEYLHKQGHIHRDVKAGNILIHSDGDIKLADFGVSACMFDKGDRQRSRNTFVGTPCWMAPEVLQPGTGYDFKADIWSFGITALELAHGHAPFSKYPPMKVLLMTIQNAPPGLDYDRDKRFSKSFKEMVAMCLVKDQTKRPTAEKLLKHSFFRNAKPPELSVKKLFADLPPLWKRVKDLQVKDAAQLALKKMPSAEQEALSLSEYKRGVSAWNFDIEDLKLQASCLHVDVDTQEIMEDGSLKYHKDHKAFSIPLSPLFFREETVEDEITEVKNQSNEVKVPDSDLEDFESLVPAIEKDVEQSRSKIQSHGPRQTRSGPLIPGSVLSKSLSEGVRSIKRGETESQQVAEKAQQSRRDPNFSGPLNLPNRASANSLSAPIKSSGGFKDSFDEKSKTNLVQIKGRFSVTSENVDLAKDIPLSTVSRPNSQLSDYPGSPLRKSASVGSWIFDSKHAPNMQSSREAGSINVPASVLMPHLQNLLQQTSVQQDLIATILSNLQTESENASQNGNPALPRVPESNGGVEVVFSERERVLLLKISELQSRSMNTLVDELTSEKLKFMQLQQRLSSLDEDGDERGVDS